MSDWPDDEGGANSGTAKWNGASGENGSYDGFDDPGGRSRYRSGVDGDGGGNGGRACFNCGEEGHNKADCPNARVMRCHHCNKEGHLIRDCPTAPHREFTGECHHCQKQGHMAKNCPDKPAEVCKNCQQEGHVLATCPNPRRVDRSDIAEVDAETAWSKILKAVRESDLDDAKEAIQEYIKACPETTYSELEIAFRSQKIGLYLIAMTNASLLPTLTHMDLQGNLDKTYRVHYRFCPKPNRPRERELWPSSPEENMARLADAGEPVSRGLSKCNNCNELGHIAKNCPQEKTEVERTTIMCYNCGEGGHRVRDCPRERVDKFACKNCGKSGHKAAECPEPRVAGADVECRKCRGQGHYAKDCPQGGGGGGRGCFNCSQEGHSARDCPEPKKLICRNCNKEGHRANECQEPKDMSKIQCRNCDEFGHQSRECPKPRDYSRIQCQNCGEYGHTKVRCKNPTVGPDDFDTGNGGKTVVEANGGHDDGWS